MAIINIVIYMVAYMMFIESNVFNNQPPHGLFEDKRRLWRSALIYLLCFYSTPLVNSFKYINSGAFTPACCLIFISFGDSKKAFALTIDDHLEK